MGSKRDIDHDQSGMQLADQTHDLAFLRRFPARLQARLVFEHHPQTVKLVIVHDVRLRNPEVSRNHCQIEQLNGVLVIRDLHSTNGTFVNGHRVAETVLRPGDQVSLEQTQFLARYERDTSCTSAADAADGGSHSFCGGS